MKLGYFAPTSFEEEYADKSRQLHPNIVVSSVAVLGYVFFGDAVVMADLPVHLQQNTARGEAIVSVSSALSSAATTYIFLCSSVNFHPL